MSGGISNVRGIYYQMVISVERILELIYDSNMEFVRLEAVNDEEEDINTHFMDGKIRYEQIKTKKIGNWTFNDFFYNIFLRFNNFLKKSTKNEISCRFISNAPPNQ